jgi:hypothetical protein
MPILIMNLLKMTILILPYNYNTYTDFAYNDFTCNTDFTNNTDFTHNDFL